MSELRRLFDLACELPAAQRLAVLQANSADAALIGEVLELLDADDVTHTRSRAGVSALIAQLGATELHAGDTLGAWRLMRELGHGGMGAVYLAERADGHFQQQAAIKLIRGFADDDAAARFARERQLLADLRHPQIARLLDGGATPGGAPYLVMEYVEGMPLDTWCRETSAGFDERLRLFVSVCETLQFAHQRLIVHCDLKPSNVLVRADGVPVLLDFGIARALDRSEESAIGSGRQFFTPRYASPEQARGETPTLQSDVYALGALLYELASGQVPPVRDTAARTTLPAPSSVATRELPWRKRLHGDIDAIVTRARAFDAARRYPSALALAEDVRRIGRHEPVLARPRTLSYVGARLLRRRWPAFALGSFVLLLAAAFTWRTVQAERLARAHAHVAEKATEFLTSTFALADPSSNERRDYSAREVLDRGAARIQTELLDEPRVRARLLEALGNAYRGINERDAGRPLLDRAANLYLDSAVNDPAAAARSLSEEAQSIMASGQSSREAEQVARRAIELTQRYDADNRQQIADSLEALAWILETERRMPEALAAGRQALSLREQDGAAAEKIALNATRLCRILSNTGDVDQALSHCERAVSLLRNARNVQSPAYPAALLKYSYVLASTRQFASAAVAIHESDDAARNAFGEGSLDLARHLENAAAILSDMGRFDEAEALLAQSTPVILRRNGAQSDQYARALADAGWIKFRRGEFAASVDLLRRACEINAADAGAQYGNGWQVYRSRLGEALVESGAAGPEARKLLDEVTARRSAAGADAYELAYTRLPMARWHVANGQFDEAEELLDQVEAVNSKGATDYHAYAQNTRAAIARAKSDHTRALGFDDMAYRLMLDANGADSPYSAHYALILAGDLRKLGRHGQADALEKQYRALFEQAFRADSAFRRELALPVATPRAVRSDSAAPR